MKEITIASILLSFGISECGPDGPPCDGGLAGAAGEITETGGIGGGPAGGEVGGMGGFSEPMGGTGGAETGGVSATGGSAGSTSTCNGWVTAAEWDAVSPMWPIGDLIGCQTTSGSEIANCVTREEVEAYCMYCGGHLPLYNDLDFMDLLNYQVTVYLDDPASSTGCGDLNGPGTTCPELSFGPPAFEGIGVYCSP